MAEFLHCTALLLVLLNPFLVIVYLVDVLKKLEKEQFTRVLIRAGLISSAVFCCFALVGDTIFTKIVNAEFASFQMFGGVVFLLVGLQFVFRGPDAIELLRGESKHVSGAVAMPVLIGPSTLSASIIIGERIPPLIACGAILLAVGIALAVLVVLKAIHDYVLPRNEGLVEQYIEVAGRITALYVGTVSVEMIMRGVRTWSDKL